MLNVLTTPGPVKLEGFQAIMKPSKFGYQLCAVIDYEYLTEEMWNDRYDALLLAEKKLKNLKTRDLRPEPWQKVSNGYKVKFSWTEEYRPKIYDSQNNLVNDDTLEIPEESMVNLAFYQKPYILKDGKTYGTSLKLVEVQVVRLGNPDTPRFPKTDGWVYKTRRET